MVPVRGNRISLLKNGIEFFPALEAEIDAARIEVRLETYIYQEDAAGVRVGEALKRAAARGVKVRLLIDGFGARGLSPAFLSGLRAAGVAVPGFRPNISWLTLRRHPPRRLHRQTALIAAPAG